MTDRKTLNKKLLVYAIGSLVDPNLEMNAFKQDVFRMCELGFITKKSTGTNNSIQSSLSRTLKGLMLDGYVRQKSKDRKLVLELTQKGSSLLKEVRVEISPYLVVNELVHSQKTVSRFKS